ncbi:DUF5366 family protein [Viridibacillus sp. FSL R5-0477]|uniref:Uncharacterized protein n=1 Tax=Viridibacillus arenosi FSL R5-213 TaxID=1227360 RepID=W4EPI9_9BACL|nr:MULTISPECIES: DUF5366 family protein [Viridibacillus]ETT81927.1 hypothetical protein C176_17186 [Viridibacillus arenosi FSL R5-213]OMC81491.1 hypothetical protein BK130_15190 [Viridibacillus sp. FSL H8-0123]OMC86977.1 hypothetical protein BK128_09950 [Viridibacillus sp. FSL H7-0596]OMC90539.1 hypothetical protein BK137_13230 [Viridibacillus arenosi]
MKNPYVYGYLPLITIILFSLTFGLYTVTESIEVFKSIGVYTGMREFLSEIQLRVFLLIVFALCYFMLFSALKLIGETIHELAMLFFSKDIDGKTVAEARGGNVIFFFGAIASAFGIQSFMLLMIIFLLTVLTYFIYVIYKISNHMTLGATIGVLIFDILLWSILITLIVYVIFKLYNGILASLPI